MRFRAVAGVVAIACATGAAAAGAQPPDQDPFYAVPANVGGLADGAIIASRPVTATALSVPMPARSWQILYKTVDNTGAPTATVTTVMVPTATWTGGGPRPVVSYQTAEDGVGTKCSPSYAINGGVAASSSNSAPETLLMLQALLRGWTVVASDYEGPRSMFLGSEGEARGVLDGLRAARSFAPAGIDRRAPTGLWGYSGGALASTAAAQLQPQYAPDLKLAALAIGGVVADLRATIHAFSGSYAGGALVMGFVGVDRAYPEYHVTRYLNDTARTAMAGSQSDCINDATARYPFARLEQYAPDPSIIDGPTLRPLFDRINPLTFPGVPAAPVYDYHAVGDELAPIGPDRALVERFCRAGVPVQHVEDLGSEHISLVATGALGALQFLGDRFAGRPAPNGCARIAGAAAEAACLPAGPRVSVEGVHATARRLSIRGTAVTSCGSARIGRVVGVAVSAGRLAHGGCEFMGADGRLRPPRTCRRPISLRARGAGRWVFARSVALRPGRYVIYVRGVDAAGRRTPVGSPDARFRIS